MGPVILSRIAADTLGWAHCCCWKILPMVINGPCLSMKKCCWWPWMGPVIISRNVAYSLEWTHYCPWKILLMATEWAQCLYKKMLMMPLNGPIVMAEKCWWWLQIGPMFLPRNAADPLGWPHYYCWNRYQWQWMGCMVLPRNATDTLGWAHYCCWTMLPMAMNGFSVSNEKCCQYPCMGPLLVLMNSVDGYEWTHCYY